MVKGSYKFVDVQLLNEMADGNNDFICDLIRMFIQQEVIFKDQLDALLTQNDHYALAKLAHKIKGAASMVGLASVADAMRTLEDAASSGCLSHRCEELVEKFKVISSEAIVELEAILNEIQ